MAQRPSVRWNERNERWMAWVRFPDGSRRKVERTDKAAAQHDLDELLALRAQAMGPGPRRERALTFNEAIDAWFDAGCPNVAPSRTSRHARVKSPATVANAQQLLGANVRPAIGALWIDRTTTERLERVFNAMDVGGKSTSTIDRSWNYLNQACQLALRQRRTKVNPAADVLLPARKPSKPRKAFSIEQAQRLLAEAIPADPRPAMWLTALMCGLRPGELAGLRWRYLELDADEPTLEVAERALEVGKKYVGQAPPKTERSKRRMGLHPLLVAALRRHRDESQMLGLYDDDGFVFCTRNGTPMSISNLRRAFKTLCERAGLGTDWTTYELRHSFVSLVADQLDDLVKVADLAGHVDTRHRGLPPPGPPVHPPRHRRLEPLAGDERRRTERIGLKPIVLRAEEPPDDVVVVRGGEMTGAFVRRTATDAHDELGIYAVSVFLTLDAEIDELRAAEPFLVRCGKVRLSTVGRLRAGGFALIPTLDRPHYDIVLPDIDDATLERLEASFDAAVRSPGRT